MAMVDSKFPSTMSGSEVLGCVELVTAAFAEASELMGSLCRKQKKRKGERDVNELLLFQALEHGTRSVQKAYDDGYYHLGLVFKLGDDEARERLLSIAMEMNSDVVQSLQTACDSPDKPTVDLAKVHESAIAARHGAVRTLGALRRRLHHLRPLAVSRFSPDSSVCGDEYFPSKSDAAPAPPPPERSGLRRMLSVGGGSISSSSASHRRVKSDGPTHQRLSLHHPVAVPAPLSINTSITKSPKRFSSFTTSSHHRSKSDFSIKRMSRHKSEGTQCSDMPNHGLGLTNIPSPKKQNKHQSMLSTARSSTTEAPILFTRPQSTYTVPSILYEATAKETHPIPTPLITSSPTHLAPFRAPTFVSPIAEVSSTAELDTDTASVSRSDYDADSVYSRDTDDETADPGTPMTDTGSADSTRHSRSEARTPTSSSNGADWSDMPSIESVKAHGSPLMRMGFRTRARASTVDSRMTDVSDAPTTPSLGPPLSPNKGVRKSWFRHRVSRSMADVFGA